MGVYVVPRQVASQFCYAADTGMAALRPKTDSRRKARLYACNVDHSKAVRTGRGAQLRMGVKRPSADIQQTECCLVPVAKYFSVTCCRFDPSLVVMYK